MGFCRRCGDIVTGVRCKCGGTVVAPTVSWTQTGSSSEMQDKWSQTYVSREKSISPVRPKSRGPPEGDNGPLPPASSNSVPSSSSKRFPRPVSAQITGSATMDAQVSDHIESVLSQTNKSFDPLKPTVTGPKPESGILPSIVPNDTTLSKVYGSVLQPKETLTTHSCASCLTPFLPDATIYPDPSIPAAEEPRFLCRHCFIMNGGAKGICPNCSKPVTIVKAEGGFVYAADKYWHKKCFKCEGCSKDIGDSPMVDLLGRPSCVDCFDTCLKREPRTPKRNSERQVNHEERRNPGGFALSPSSNTKFRESSPAIEELEQRLGISKSREGSPAIEELSQRLVSIGKDYQPRYSSPSLSSALGHSQAGSGASPVRRWERVRSPEVDDKADAGLFSSYGSPRRSTGSPAPTPEAVEEMKQRFLKNSLSPASSTATLLDSPTTTPLRLSRSSISLRNSRIPVPVSRTEPLSPMSSTPDLVSDFSDSTTISSLSGVDSPPRSLDIPLDFGGFSRISGHNPKDLLQDPENVIAEETRSQLNTPHHTAQSTIRGNKYMTTPTTSPSADRTLTSFPIKMLNDASVTNTCAKCNQALFSLKEGGKFVTVPVEQAGSTPQTFHKECFKCAFCNGVFTDSGNGQAIFVKSKAGPAHVDCAPTEKIVINKSPSASSLKFNHSYRGSTPNETSLTTAPSRPRVDTSHSSSRLDRPLASSASFSRFGSRTTCPGCHRSVSPMEKGVVLGPQGSRWHVDCLVCGGKRPPSQSNIWMLGRGEIKKKEPGCGKKLDSAAKTDSEGRIWCRECLLLLGIGGSPQPSPNRGSIPSPNTAIPQLTGTTTIARQFTGLGGDTNLLKQLTGGSISPTRSLSPTKQLGNIRPRPKSVIGTRSSKSIDEGRGMFLVRQLTGASNHWEGS